jgi:gas vesicle protein
MRGRKTKGTELDTEFDLEEESGSRGGSGILTGALLAAAVGAGIALLLAPEKGSETRHQLGRRARELQLKERVGRLQSDVLRGAGEGWRQYVKGGGSRRRRLNARRREATIGVLGTLLGAGAALLLAPESGERTRERIGRGIRRARNSASLRWQPHHPANARAFDDFSVASGKPVRSVQELGREGNDVF